MTLNPREHLSPETLEKYFVAGSPITLLLADRPTCLLKIDPKVERIELWTPVDGPEPDVAALSRVSVASVYRDGEGPWFVLDIDAHLAHVEAYALVEAVVDDLVTGRPLRQATALSIDSFHDLLATRARLSEDRAVGLLGELLVLNHLLTGLGEKTAVGAWLGPDRGEHDFGLTDVDLEVKATLSEKRTHLIASETQLAANPHRPLWLVSIQLTRTGPNRDSVTLPELVGRVRGRLVDETTAFDGLLRAAGWRAGDADLYRERYLLRTTPAAYLVDDDFPAITRDHIETMIHHPELVAAVSYRLDLTSWPPGTPPTALAAFAGPGPTGVS
ncbi:PD-(D/E)XK motif protein [Pseudofrankia inefficax]|uniref:PD-(D/E)XK motif protein n=1 Tax=Pseudofrankia inefficax (strain DSM 45817 / CECT 9037 / DDB 130130 / EuI1c) TaxID=298654 RepID=E3JC94_PSEI1|nr:PD-(D/E)XK motif protein [Pseudofrankia inefficax]ADP84683.1 hypothetical protein FraEuI1c_6713 [Pseudofrankia inefficax]